ncbi:LapA family protein [bacterium]|nr:LapA family protein [bacterium]
MKNKIMISIILVSFALIFIIQNFAVIDIRFLFWTLSVSSALLMFSLLLTGLILGWSLHGYSMHRSKNK